MSETKHHTYYKLSAPYHNTLVILGVYIVVLAFIEIRSKMTPELDFVIQHMMWKFHLYFWITFLKNKLWILGSGHRWARGGAGGGYPPLKKKNYDPPPSLQNHPHPLRNGFWPPTPDFELFKLATFFFFKKKKSGRIFFLPAGAGTRFCPKTPKSAIKKNCRPPPAPPWKNFLWPPSSSKELAHLWVRICLDSQKCLSLM